MYRSFVTCNDPKGVITCRTIRKSKTKAKGKTNCVHKMEDKREISLRNLKSLNTNFDSEETVTASSRDESHSPASFQLMEVSRGAQKLNNMIECWSRASTFGSQPKDIAKELLKGAIDLQDSLVMLGKLHEASRYMARLKREQQAMEGSGRRTEELKKVIRESIVKQTSAVTPEESVGEVVVASESASVSTSESACSSQSSLLESRKGPNLIARLMGLHEYSVPPFRAEPKKRFEGKIREIDRSQSLKEILEGMRMKGVLKNNSSEGIPSNACSDQSDSKQKLIDDGPPIVLIKPVRVPCPEPKEIFRSVPKEEEEDPLYRRKMLKKLRRSEEVIREVPKEKVVAAKASGSIKPRASSPVKHSQTRNDGIDKKGDKIRKVLNVNKRNSVEKNLAKSTSVVKCEDQGKRTPIKSRKSVSDQSYVVKNRNSRRVSAQPSTTDQTTVHNCCAKKNYKKKEKPLKKSTTEPKVVIETSGRRKGEKKPKICSKSTECHEVKIHTNSEAQLALLEHQRSKEEGLDISESTITDSVSPTENTSLEKSIIESTDNACGESADIKTLETEISLKALLLNSSEFRNRAEELFDLNITTSRAAMEQPASESLGKSNVKLLLDCANELIERKSTQDSQMVHSVSRTCSSKLRRRGSMETLVDEVCGAVEALRDYGRVSEDGLYATLERDLMCTGAMNGAWDPCWKTGFSLEDAERVVRDIERLVLSGLIHEVFA